MQTLTAGQCCEQTKQSFLDNMFNVLRLLCYSYPLNLFLRFLPTQNPTKVLPLTVSEHRCDTLQTLYNMLLWRFNEDRVGLLGFTRDSTNEKGWVINDDFCEDFDDDYAVDSDDISDSSSDDDDDDDEDEDAASGQDEDEDEEEDTASDDDQDDNSNRDAASGNSDESDVDDYSDDDKTYRGHSDDEDDEI